MIVAPSSTATSQSWLVPIESRSSPCSAASSARRAKCGREASGSLGERRHRHQPADPHRAAGDELAELGHGSTPPLPSSPATLTSTRISVSGVAVALELLEHRLGGDRVDQPHQRHDPLHLAALHVADEVPGEAVAAALVLGLEVLEAVLADQLDPGLGERVHLLGDDVLGRREDLDLRPAALAHPLEVARARPRGRCRGSAQASIQTSPAWRPVRPASRRWEKNSSGLQLVQRPAASTASTPAAASSRRATSGRSSIRPSAIPSPSAANAVEHLVADLVAAGADPRPDRGRRRPDLLRPRARRSRRRARASRSGASRRRRRRRAPPAGSRRPGRAA